MRTLKRLRRAVITGIGCVSPIGVGRERFWQSVREGRSGIGPVTRFDASDLPVRIAGEVKNFDPDQFIPPKDRQHVSHAVAFAIAAADLAFTDAGLKPKEMSLEERRDVGIVLGSGGASLSFLEKQYRYYFANEAKKASIYTIPTATPGSLPSELSMPFGLKGFSHLVSTGCTSSTDAIAYAAQNIILGRINTVLTVEPRPATGIASVQPRSRRFRVGRRRLFRCARRYGSRARTRRARLRRNSRLRLDLRRASPRAVGRDRRRAGARYDNGDEGRRRRAGRD
jgi:hypothetical protein